MRNFENANKFKKDGIKPHQIITVFTTEPDYEMTRYMMLHDIDGIADNEYLILEGSHCSCYDFDDTEWQGTVYSEEELKILARTDYYKNKTFWVEVLRHIQ